MNFDALKHTLTTRLVLNLWLLLMVIGTALLLVRYQYESRRITADIGKGELGTRALQSQLASLTASKQTLSTPARVEQTASQQGMHKAAAGQTLYLGERRD